MQTPPAALTRRAAVLLALTAGAAFPAEAQTQTQTQARDTLTVGIAQATGTFHPNIESMLAKSYILGFARRPLTGHGPDWKPVCFACEAVPTIENGGVVLETTPDGKPGMRVTWRLREDGRWGDGRPVTAEDMRFAWEAGRAFETGFGGAEFYRSAYEFQSSDPRTVTLRFDRVNFEAGSAGGFEPLPAHIDRAIWEADRRNYRSRTAYDTDTANPGLWNGPYRIAAVQPGAGVTLERNAAWAGPAPAFRRINVRVVENSAALEAQLLAGQVDMISGELGLSLDQAIALEKRARGRFRFEYRPGLVWEHLDLRMDQPPLSDLRVRQALMMAIDRGRIVGSLFENRQPVAATAVHPDDPMVDKSLAPWPFDLARAQALLEEAGWKPGPDGIRRNAEGARLSVDLQTTAGNRSRETVLQVIQGMWRAAGVEARIGNQPPRVLFGETLSKRQFNGAVLFAWISSPENVPRTTLHSDEIPRADRNWSGQNFPGYANPEMDALLEALPQELDAEKRRPLWARLQAMTHRDLPALPLWHRAEPHVLPQWLDGVRPTGNMSPSSLWVTDWRVR
ncbi:peptide ABC transporter substrate-binding protein [Roseomonas populi]|uniref:Peptide ABC transporter substrate-binding protein n=1 Tax=Roseomonas populi TaxID=3121582 RepID=A0ABT1WYC4_9PROT|nr:peptide ABC transporter substrate-binding protein [Roseomonas pecuniae]MCR0980842.1 peptide ABC transporter substrate-binding protein [Roseomonas pecuniae]